MHSVNATLLSNSVARPFFSAADCEGKSQVRLQVKNKFMLARWWRGEHMIHKKMCYLCVMVEDKCGTYMRKRGALLALCMTQKLCSRCSIFVFVRHLCDILCGVRTVANLLIMSTMFSTVKIISCYYIMLCP
jgi:hypothetical protein